MRLIARAIVIHETKLLVVYRYKNGDDFVTLPGGGLEAGESFAQAAKREVYEETSLRVSAVRQIYSEIAEPYGHTQYWLCQYLDGALQLHPDSEEALESRGGINTYRPAWLDVSRLRAVDFRSGAIKAALLADLPENFPTQSKRLQTYQ